MNEYIKNSFILSTTPLILKILKFKSYPTPWSDSNLQAMKKNHFSLQKRGLDDKIKFPYFPYRDDNRLLLMAISRMVEDYIWV